MCDELMLGKIWIHRTHERHAFMLVSLALDFQTFHAWDFSKSQKI